MLTGLPTEELGGFAWRLSVRLVTATNEPASMVLTNPDLYVLFFAASYGPLAWVLPAEVFPSSKRAKGVGAGTAMIWLANFIIGVVVPEMLISLGWGTFLFFGLFCVAAAVFSFLFVPETSGKSLEQVAAVFGDNLADDERLLHARVAREILADPMGGMGGKVIVDEA